MVQAKATTVAKPRQDFPLFPHARGYWAKKVTGPARLLRQGGRRSERQGRPRQVARPEGRSLAGRTPRVAGDGLTIRDLCNRFLTAKQGKMEAGGTVPGDVCRPPRDVCPYRQVFRPNPPCVRPGRRRL